MGFGNSLPGLDDLESTLRRLSLNYPSRNSIGFKPNNNFISQPLYENFASNDNGYDHDHDKMQLQLQMRIHVAAAARRAQTTMNNCSIPNCSNSMSNRYLNQSNGISYVPNGNRVNGQIIPCHDSSLLEGFREKLVSMAKDQGKCRYLQFKIDEGSIEFIDMILYVVKDHIYELLTHQFGNYLIQKIFNSTSVTDEKKDLIVLSIIQDVHMLRNVCMDINGTRVVQKMLENVKTRMQIDLVINVMKQITVPLMKDVNGGYVIEQCIKVFPVEYQCEILYVVAMNCVDIATDKRGCSVIQKCMKHALRDAIVPLVHAIIYNAALLAENPYGNYVVQYLVEMKIVEINGMIISELGGKYVQLSRNKHASNVVQHLLKYSEERDAMIIILELMNSNEFLSVLQDPYGNYVAQTAVEYSKGYLHKRIVDSIVTKYRDLCSHLYGKKVLAFVEKQHSIRY
ncbi:putative armadillo-like helical protein [Lupinus albus]|uniref:Putative armadillo-like helical protein n=1 Tax=Lupinus albus TaxID=3870 RepID=A0A6A4R022_LUPAL|nr:putative armadillo-like helical protein [Lupinus albus]